MAKGSKKKAGKRGKKAGKRGKKGGRAHKERTAATLNLIKKRLQAHEYAASLPDFHGGKSPFRSGCGRPRGS